jgi:hypothetical protein
MQLAAAAASSISKSAQAARRLNGYVEIKVDPAEDITRTSRVTWAIDQLRASLKDKEIAMQGSGKAAATIVIAPLKSALTTGFDLPEERKPEMIALIPHHDSENLILVSGIDARGLIYGLLELTDRVRATDDVLDALTLYAPVVETTALWTRSYLSP